MFAEIGLADFSRRSQKKKNPNHRRDYYIYFIIIFLSPQKKCFRFYFIGSQKNL